MQELIKHLSEDKLSSLYWNEDSQRIEYSEQTRHAYQVILRALKDGADRIQSTPLDLIWSREKKVIGKVNQTPSPDPRYPVSYANQLRMIVDKDPIMKKWTRVISDEEESIIVEFML